MINLRKLHFIRSEKGALSVEFAMVFMGCMLVIFLVYDIYVAIALQGKLDRSTYSAATVFRERSIFYKGDSRYSEVTNDKQVIEIESLLNSMMGSNDVSVKVEALYIEGSDANPSNIETATMNVDPFFGTARCCSGYFSKLPPLTSYANLTAYSTSNRWIPLFRISACIENRQSLFRKAMNQVGITDGSNDICSSSIVVSRCSGDCKTPHPFS